MRSPGDEKQRDSRYYVAAEDASRFAGEAGLLLDRAVGVEWYERPGSDVDLAALTLCRLRRARAGEKGRAPARRRSGAPGSYTCEYAGDRMARQPSDLVHGRERLSRGGRTLVPEGT